MVFNARSSNFLSGDIFFGMSADLFQFYQFSCIFCALIVLSTHCAYLVSAHFRFLNDFYIPCFLIISDSCIALLIVCLNSSFPLDVAINQFVCKSLGFKVTGSKKVAIFHWGSNSLPFIGKDLIQLCWFLTCFLQLSNA